MSIQNVILLKIMKVTTNWESMHHSWINVEHNQALLVTIINSQISSSGGKLHPTFTPFHPFYTSNIPHFIYSPLNQHNSKVLPQNFTKTLPKPLFLFEEEIEWLVFRYEGDNMMVVKEANVLDFKCVYRNHFRSDLEFQNRLYFKIEGLKKFKFDLDFYLYPKSTLERVSDGG